MLDSFLNTVKRGAERVQRRGEEVAQVARLRVEVFQLGRELDGLYARLGRAFHAGAEVGVLQGVRDDIARVDEEIRARERLIEELADPPADVPDVTTTPARPAATPTAAPAAMQPSPAHAPQAQFPQAQSPQEVSPMTNTRAPAPDPASPDPTVPHSDERPVPGTDTASMGNEAGRDPQRHDNTVGQADAMKGHNDPLAK